MGTPPTDTKSLRRAMTDLDSIFIFVHRCNMSRYRRLLRTPLTDLERQFVLRRVGEEKSVLQDPLAKRRPRRPELVSTLPDDALA